MAANATRAVAAGMGRMPARRPPPFYAFDADIGRLAVSTPRYHTAILAVNRSKVPHGGIELARLYDADGDPVGGTGGHAPSAFGVVVNPDAGPFQILDEAAAASRDGVTVRTANRFRRDFIQTRWTVSRAGGSGTDQVRVLFPTSGRSGVAVEARLRSGRTVVLTGGGRARPRLRDVRDFRLSSAHGSYVVALLGRPGP